jgi:hypothetical protein
LEGNIYAAQHKDAFINYPSKLNHVQVATGDEGHSESLIRINELDVLNGPELLDVLRSIAGGADPEQAINSKVVQKLNPILDRSSVPTNGHGRQHQNQQVDKN